MEKIKMIVTILYCFVKGGGGGKMFIFEGVGGGITLLLMKLSNTLSHSNTFNIMP